jgi:hypothetical protein
MHQLDVTMKQNKNTNQLFILRSYLRSSEYAICTLLLAAARFDSWRELQTATTLMLSHQGRPFVLPPGIEPGALVPQTSILSIKLRELYVSCGVQVQAILPQSSVFVICYQ